VRTFTLLGIIGGVSGWLVTLDHVAFAALLFAAAIGLVIAAYVAASRTDIDATTEVSAVVVLAAAFVSGLGFHALASAIVALTALMLVEKSRLHALVGRLDDEELRAAARFAVMAVVILPLLPVGPYGPGAGIRPRLLWLLVLFFSGLSFAGYLARRAAGARFGYPLAGLLGGLVSSTNVTLSFARASKGARASSVALAYGVVAANTVLPIRVAIATIALEPALALAVWPYLTASLGVGALALLLGLRHVHAEADTLDPPKNPLQVFEAIQMVVLFQVVLFGVELVRRFGNDMGLIASGAVLGLTDMDALTISMARSVGAGVAADLAARAVAAGLLANTLLKLVLACAIGEPRFRRVAGSSLAAMAAATLAVLAWL
jgi:uncharacterized membrane protein (DUF4010 family)